MIYVHFHILLVDISTADNKLLLFLKFSSGVFTNTIHTSVLKTLIVL